MTIGAENLGFQYFTGVQTMALSGLRRAKADPSLRTAGYNPARWADWLLTPRDLPPLSWHIVRQMLLDETVSLSLEQREAPLHAIEFAYKEGENWVPGVRASSSEVADYVLRTAEDIWLNYIDEIARSQVWGWSGGEVVLRVRDNLVEFDTMEARRAEDTYLLTRGGKAWGVQFRRVAGVEGGKVDLKFPRAMFHPHRPEPGDWYGRTVLLGCYVPWADKCFAGGARDVRRLFMVKDSYGGTDLGYPTGESYVEGHDEPIKNEIIAQRIVEQITAGGVTTRPSERDENGNEKWPLTRATVASNPQHILEYPRNLDGEIRRGIGIPDDVIDSEGSGAWAGKRVPAGGFYTSIDKWANQITRNLSEQNLEPLVELNFGRDAWFELTHKPIALTMMDIQGEAVQNATAGFGPPLPNPGPGLGVEATGSGFGRMGLDLMDTVGGGLVEAADVVDAAETLFAKRRERRIARLASGGEQEPTTTEGDDTEGAEPPEDATGRPGGRRGPLRMAARTTPPEPGERKTDPAGRTYEFCGTSRRWRRVQEG